MRKAAGHGCRRICASSSRSPQPAGKVAAVNFNIRFYPLNQHLRAAVADGVVGDVRLITGRYFQDWLMLDTDWNWRLEPEIGGRLRAVGDIGSHWLDLTSFVTGLHVDGGHGRHGHVHQEAPHAGRARRVVLHSSASTDTVEREIRTEDVATILLRYDNGARGMMAVSQISAGPQELAPVRDRRQCRRGRVGQREARTSCGWATAAGQTRSLARDAALMTTPAARPRHCRPATSKVSPTRSPRCSGPFTQTSPTAGCARTRRTPTFADGHEEMLVGDAIARERADGAGSTSHARRRPGQSSAGGQSVETRLPDRAVPGYAADGRRRLGRGQRLRLARDRLLAAEPAASSADYAGTSHIDVANLSDQQAQDIRGEIEGKGLAISGLGFYPNPLHPDPAVRDPAIAHIKLVIEACRKMGVPFMNTFMGGDSKKNLDENWDEALRVWPDIVKHAQDNGVKVTIENCPMIFSNDEWPGGNNIAWSPYDLAPDHSSSGAARSGSTTTRRTWSG